MKLRGWIKQAVEEAEARDTCAVLNFGRCQIPVPKIVTGILDNLQLHYWFSHRPMLAEAKQTKSFANYYSTFRCLFLLWGSPILGFLFCYTIGRIPIILVKLKATGHDKDLVL